MVTKKKHLKHKKTKKRNDKATKDFKSAKANGITETINANNDA